MALEHFSWLLLVCLSWVLAMGWLWRTVVSLRNLPRVPDLLSTAYSADLAAALQSESPSVTARKPALTVIVPARDEASSIRATLESLLATEGLMIEIIAVDDRSTDATGQIMDAIATTACSDHRAGAHSLRVIHVEQLPRGWMGKTHAMAVGAREAAAPCLLFTDGDVIYRPDTLARAMCFVEREQADHLVIVPTVIMRSAGERMMISFLQVMSVWFARPWRVADPRARRDFIGVGAFNLVRAEIYQRIGGFESLRMEVIEDMRLGFKIKRAGYRQRVAFGRDLVRIRWAEGAMGVVGNLTKNAFSAFRFRLVFLLGGCVTLLIQATLPFAGLFLGWPGRIAGIMSITMMVLLYKHFERHTGTGIIYAATFPLAAMLMIYALVRSMVLTLVAGGVRWRGTFYPLDELKKHCGPLW